MKTLNVTVIVIATIAAGCGGSGSTGGGSTEMAGTPDMAGGPIIEGQHGRLIDYFSNMPLAGATITDGANSVTTGADGSFLLPAPDGAMLAPTASITGYATLYMPEAMAASVDVDRGVVPMAAVNTFVLEQSILANDQSKALVHILLNKSGGCTSLAGGTITVRSPAGAKVAYFSASSGLPTSATMFDIAAPKPAAVVYDVEPGADVDLAVDVPGCTQAAAPVVGGMALTGKVTTVATEPGDYGSALIYLLQ